MSVELAQKIITDLVENNFSGTINISENGEALMNQKADEIIALIGNALPNCKMTLFTNMNLMDKTRAETILKAGLNHITISIDGNSSKTYQYMKGLDFGILKKNMHDFINVRDKNNYKCKIVIYVISAYNYHKTIINDTPPFKDDTQNIVEYWSGYTRKTDVVEKLSNLGYWAIANDKKPINIKQCMHLD